MWAYVERTRPDLVVLDLMLPGEDGLSLCRRLRARGDLPVIIVSARGEETERIIGLEMGADDYLPKPFAPRELLARIKGVLRRTRALPENLKAEDARTLRFAGWRLDTLRRVLLDAASVVTPLSGAEYRLLTIFLTHPHRVLTRDQLMDLMKGRESEAFDRSIDVQVSRLRRRLREDAREPQLIKTVRAEGYVFSSEVGYDA
jgi:two-component system OmpR family response regulator